MSPLKVLDLRPNTKPLVPAGDRETKKLYILNEYSKALQKCGCHVTVVYLEGKADQEVVRRTAADRVIFLEAKKIKPFGKIVPAAMRLRHIIKTERFDRVIGHWFKPGMVLGLSTLFQPALMARYLVMHGPSDLHKWRRKLFAFLFLRKRFIYLAVSDSMREYLLAMNWKISKDQVITHYNTIDIPAMERNHLSRHEVRNTFGLQEEDIACVTVGWMFPHKGHIDLLKALEVLGQDDMLHLKLVIVGEGRLNDFLRKETRQRQLEDQVLFAGGLPDAYQYLPGFDILILPSLREPFGVVLLEAMAAKLPIIASDVGGIPEVMGSFGTLVPPNRPQALAEVMKEYARKSQQERREIGEQGYQRLWKYFSNEIFAHKLCSLIER